MRQTRPQSRSSEGARASGVTPTHLDISHGSQDAHDSREAPAGADPGSEGTLSAETKRFGRSAAVYLVGSLLIRGTTILLTPLYTRAMGPGDYAVVAIANAVAAVLAIAFGLSLSACIPRLSFEYAEQERRGFLGTLLVLSFLLPLPFVAILYALGETGHLGWMEPVRFTPHLQLVIWSSFFSVFVPLPLAVYNTREQPGRSTLLSGVSSVLQLTCTVILVAWWGRGAVGVLEANLLSAAGSAVVAVAIMVRMSRFERSLPGTRSALAYSLPLVPHLIANWVLAISDRLILNRYVAAAEVGRYSLAYMFNVLVSVVAAAIGSALQPMAYRQLKDPSLAGNVPPLGTYAMVLMLTFGLGVSLTAPEAISIIAPRSYAGASAAVPGVVLGAVFQGIYLILSTGTWFSMKTRPVALITLASATLNVGLNFLYVPRYGAMAAAVSTAVSYGVSALLHGILAHRLHPIAWEYRRWALASAVALICYLAGMRLPLTGVLPNLVAKTGLVAIVFPGGLLLCRFFSSAELARVRRGLAAAFRSARRPSK